MSYIRAYTLSHTVPGTNKGISKEPLINSNKLVILNPGYLQIASQVIGRTAELLSIGRITILENRPETSI